MSADHGHGHGHGHDHDHSRWGWLRELLPFGHGHSHASEARIDSALEGSERGIWALKITLLGPGATALFQVVIVWISGNEAVALFHAQPRMALINMPVEPCGHSGAQHHALTEHHERHGS